MLGGKMNKLKYFTKEISYIKDESKKKDMEYLINLLPEYFFVKFLISIIPLPPSNIGSDNFLPLSAFLKSII